MELDDLGYRLEPAAEAGGPAVVVVAGADQDEDGQRQPNRGRVDDRPAGAEDARLAQPPQPAPAGVLGQAEPVGQLALGQAGIGLKLGEMRWSISSNAAGLSFI